MLVKLILSLGKNFKLFLSEVIQSYLRECESFLKYLDCMELGLGLFEAIMLNNFLLDFVVSF
jgi:hypothetical protein